MAAVTEQKHLWLSFAVEMIFFTLELRNIDINVSSSANTAQLAKTKAISRILTYAIAFLAAISCNTKGKLENSNVLYYIKKKSVELKHCQMSSSYMIFYLQPQRER